MTSDVVDYSMIMKVVVLVAEFVQNIMNLNIPFCEGIPLSSKFVLVRHCILYDQFRRLENLRIVGCFWSHTACCL